MPGRHQALVVAFLVVVWRPWTSCRHTQAQEAAHLPSADAAYEPVRYLQALNEHGGGFDLSSPDSLYEAALRLEVFGYREQAYKTMESALKLDPSRPSLQASLHRLSSLGHCREDRLGSTCSPSAETPGDDVCTVQSMSYGLCGDLQMAWEEVPVGVTFSRESPHTLTRILNVQGDVDDHVFFGCRKQKAPWIIWHSFRIWVSGLKGEAVMSWIEGDDIFVIVNSFLRKNNLQGLQRDKLLLPLYELIVQRHASLRNETLRLPPWDIPKEHLDGFTMDGRVKVSKKFYDDKNDISRINLGFSTYYRNSRQEIDDFIGKAQKREVNYYGDTDKWLYSALDSLPGGLKGKDIVIMGSLQAWYESICIVYGAESTTTIEYNKLEYDHPKMRTFAWEEYVRASPKPVFDVAISISSFEHDGLGRYGDPLDPNGDLRAMNDMRSVLKEGGLLFLSVPVGQDLVVWNAHRIYGRLRLPLLLQKWALVGHSGLTMQILDGEDMHQGHDSYFSVREPIFMLQNVFPSGPNPGASGAGGSWNWSRIASDFSV